jgi:diadenosine tetraphosphate (Ap4A) HIT family hydrolase
MLIKSVVTGAALFFVGVGCGGYLFSKSLPRSFLPMIACGDHCYGKEEIAGLLVSAAVLRVPSLIPEVVLESDTCVSFRYPELQSRSHYLLFPKRDVKNIAMLTPEDIPYVVGCLAMVRQLVQRDNLQSYVVLTNGPGKQDVAYLHFHLSQVPERSPRYCALIDCSG